MKELKIYIPGHCKEYYMDMVTHYKENERPIEEALEIITDKFIIDGEWADQTIIDMRDCLIELLKEVKNK